MCELGKEFKIESILQKTINDIINIIDKIKCNY